MKQNPTAPPGNEPESSPPPYDYITFINNATKSTPVQVQPQLQPQQVQVQPQPVQVQPPRVVILDFGEEPMLITCPYCNSSTTTRIEHQLGLMSWLLCLTVSIFCLCCDFNKDVLHYCTRCNRMIGRYRRQCTDKIVLIIVVFVALGVILGILNVLIKAQNPR